LLGRYEEGEAAGRIKEKKDLAKKMIKRGVTIEIVVEDTGLMRVEVEEIKASLDDWL
jgi:2-keto-3-deoxy-L-rhamnonate aldolase RhmA